MLRTDIGNGKSSLQCTTASTTCCTNTPPEMRAGDFYLPGGGMVMLLGTTTNGYYRTRGTRHIRLNRQSAGTITGQFRCEVPDASGTTVNLFINVGTCVGCCVLLITGSYMFYVAVDITVSITAVSGTNTAGETYSLECSVTVTESTDQPTITWLDPMNNPVPSEMVTTTGSMSTLTFNPLSASHAGTYTCRATVGSIMQNATMDFTVESECSVNHDVQLLLITSRHSHLCQC